MSMDENNKYSALNVEGTDIEFEKVKKTLIAGYERIISELKELDVSPESVNPIIDGLTEVLEMERKT
jgi:hypothetical protein